MKKFILSLLSAGAFLTAQAQPTRVSKTNPQPVFVHYMPWFDSPQTSGNGQWGWHWTMDNRNPNNVDATGKRQIASHYYPLIGPYASSDPDVVEYHLLLMKLSGIDGVMVDWYGSTGNNGDIGNLLRNSNALINRTDETGLKFGLILEDRFTGSVANGRANMDYARNNYFNRPEYIRYGAGNDPLVGVFGPITFNQPGQWTDILSAAGEDVEFLSLWDNENAGANADGQYVWPYENESLDNYYSYMEEYYRNRAPSKKTVMGVAYPGFRDFYAQGQNGGTSYFDIPHNNGQTLSQMFGLVNQYKANIDLLQLATWNDFGEGTIFEPTQETGFSYLVQVQKYTGVSYTEDDLRQVYRLYNLRKKYAGDSGKQSQLNQAFGHFVALRLSDAVAMMNAVEGTTTPPPPTNPPPPPVTGVTNLSGIYTVQNRNSNLFLDVAFSSLDNGARLHQWTSNNGGGNQQFRFIHLGNGAYQIQAVHSGKSLDVMNVGMGDGVGVHQWDYVGQDHQQFVVQDAGNGYYRLVAKHSGKVLEIGQSSTATGAYLQQWASNNSATQQWRLERWGTPPPPFSITLQAEAYSNMSGVDTEGTTDTGGGRNVDWFETGDWVEYALNVPAAGAYTVDFRVASANGGATLQLRNGAGTSLGSVNVENTGGWQNWVTRTTTVNLPAGAQTLRVYAAASTGCNLNWLRISNASTPPPPSFSRQIEAEGFSVNNGMVAEACTDAGGGQNMGYINTGDNLIFNSINFPASGSYTIEYRVACGVSGGTFSCDLNTGATQFGAMTVPNTGGWQNWTTVSQTVNVNAGTYNFRILAQVGDWNLNWLRISKVGAARNTPTTAPAKTNGLALALYPNPAHNQLMLQAAEAFVGGEVRIRDAAGRQVWSAPYRGQPVPVVGLKAGLYLLELSHAATTSRLRFVKQ